MTAQASERLIYENKEQSLCTAPLELFFLLGGFHPKFISPHTALWRGYSATAYEVNELCKEIEGERQFEKALFYEQKIDEAQNSQTKTESQLCSMDIETELQKILDEQLKDSRSWMGKFYDDLSQTSMDVLSQYKDQFIQFYNELYEQDSTKYNAK